MIQRTLMALGILLLTTMAQAELLMVMKEDYGQFSYNTAAQSRIQTQEYEDPTTLAVQRLLDQSGIDYSIQLRHWPIAYRRASNRENYALFPVERNLSDGQTFEFIGPLAQYNWVVYARASSELIINLLDDLRSLRVGGYENSPFVQHLRNEGIEVSTLPYDALNLKRLVLGYIDVWVTYDENAERIAQQASYPSPKPVWTVRTINIYLRINNQTSPDTIRSLRQVAAD